MQWGCLYLGILLQGPLLIVRAVITSDFHNIIILAKTIHDDDIIVIYRKC